MSNYYAVPKEALNDVADAIRAKTGGITPIEFPSEYISEIRGINIDNREDLVDPKDVDFIDFDGRLIYSYTQDEFAELTSLPPNPTYPGLVAQGWNWTLADAQEFVAQYGALVIGQSYTTNNGRTRIYIHIPEYTVHNYSMSVTFTQTVRNGVTVYWGDGASSKTNNLTNTTLSHTYASPGDYMVEIEVTDGEISELGRDGTKGAVAGGDTWESDCVNKVEIGDNVTSFGLTAFGRMRNMVSCSIPITVTTVPDYDEALFSQCLSAIVYPMGFNSVRYRANFGSSTMLRYVSIPKSLRNFSISTYPNKLRKLTMYSLEPSSGTTNTIKLYDAYTLTHIVIPGTYKSIQTDYCRSTLCKKFFIPASVTSISATAFAYNSFCEEIHLEPTTPPTLANVNAFNSTTGTFYVPYSEDHSILAAYQEATNWSTYASRMVEESQ